MAKDMSLLFQLGVAGAVGAYSSLEKVTKSLSKVKDGTEELIKSQKKLEKMDKLRENFVNINKEYVSAVKRLAKLKEEYDRSGKGNTEFSKKIKEAEKYVEKLNKQKERQKHVFTAARSELEKEGISLNNYKKKLEETNRALAKQMEYKQNMERYRGWDDSAKSFSEKGSKQLKTGLTVGAALMVPIKLYADLEESQADLKKMIDFKNKEEEEAYFNQIRNLSENSPLQQTEVYEIAGAAAQAGIAKEDIVTFTERAMKLKVAFDMSTEASGAFIAKSKEQLGLTQEQTFAFADTINYMADNTAAKASELVDISNRVGGLARGQNVSKEANMAFGATLLSMGTSAEVASTGLKQLYLELGKGADTNKKIDAFEYLGLDSKTVNEDMAKDAEGTIVKVLEKINQLRDADRSAVLNDIFGEQAINSVTTLATNVDKVKDNLKKAHSEMTAGSVDREYANRMNTLTNIFKQTFNTFMNGIMDIGKSVAPELKESLGTLKKWGTFFGNFVKENPKLVASIIKIVAAFAAFNLGLGVGNKLISPLIKGFSWIGKFQAARVLGGWGNAFKKMFPLTSTLLGGLLKIGKGIKTVGLAMKAFLLANPIVLIIVAVVAAIAIFVVLYKKVEWFRNAAIQIFEGFKLYFGGIWKIIQGIFTGNFDLIKEGFFNMVEGVKKIFGGLIDIVKNTWNTIKGVFTDTNKKTEQIKSASEKDKHANGYPYTPTNTQNPFKLPEHWSGTNYFSGGLTSLAERGSELIQISGSNFLATNQMIANLPKGARILSNSSTKKTLAGKVKSMKDRLKDIVNVTNSQKTTTVEGDTITIHIHEISNPSSVASEVRRVLEEITSKKKRTAIV